MSSHLRFPVCLAAAILAVPAAARGQGLAKSSPFLPPQAANAPTPTAGAPLEFRGWIRTSDGMMFRLRDPARKADTWVKLNEPDSTLGVVAKQHDAERNTLTIEHQGKTLTLAVREAKIVSSGSPPQPGQMPLPGATPNVMPAVTQSVVVNPTPADEQRRLDAVAAEVARRRALREQAAQHATPRPATPPANIYGQPPPAQGQLPQAQPQLRGVPAMPPRTAPGTKPPGVQQR